MTKRSLVVMISWICDFFALEMSKSISAHERSWSKPSPISSIRIQLGLEDIAE